MAEVREFIARRPSREPVPFALTALRVEPDGTESEARATFHATPALSFGRLLGDLTDSGGDIGATFAFFERALVEDNTDPDGPDDTRTEFQRFRDFLTDPELYVDQGTVVELAEWLSEQSAERPTVQPSASRSTRRLEQRGSAGKQRKRA